MSQIKKDRKSGKNNRFRLRLPSILIVLLGVIFMLGLGYFLFPREELDPNYVPEVTGGASLKVDKEMIDFGDVQLNQMVQASFTLTNVGDRTLKFAKDPFIEVKAGC